MAVDAEFGEVKKDLVKSDNLDVAIYNSDFNADLFLFKVMTLRTFESTNGFSEAKVAFTFTHPMIRPQKAGQESELDWEVSANPK